MSLSLITCMIRLGSELYRLRIYSGGGVSIHMALMLWNNSAFDLIVSLRHCSFLLIYNQTFSIMPFLVRYSWVDLARCTVSLSSWKKYPQPENDEQTCTSHEFSSKISWYLTAFILPTTAVTVQTPCHVIHPHIMTSYLGRVFVGTKSGRYPSSRFLYT